MANESVPEFWTRHTPRNWFLVSESHPRRYTTRAGFGDSWWEKSISHGKPYQMHIMIIPKYFFYFCRFDRFSYQLAIFLVNLKFGEVKIACLVRLSHAIFLTTTAQVSESHIVMRVGFWDKWWEIHLALENHMHFLASFSYTSVQGTLVYDYTAQSWRSWKLCEMDLGHIVKYWMK